MTARWTLPLMLVVVFAAPVAAGTSVDDANVTAGGATVSDRVLVVDDDGGPYTTIQAAVAAADPGDTVRVLPGTYHEEVTLVANVSVVAPRGATLDGSPLQDPEAAFHVEDGAAPVVDGFTVVDYPMGVEAFSASGDWVVRNTTFVRAEVTAVDTSGDWVLRNVTVRDTGTAIEAEDSTGDWLVVDSVVRNVTEGNGIEAAPSSGNWTLRNVTVADVDFAAVDASSSSGDWRILNATIREALVGIGAIEASGDWSVRGSTVADVAVSERYDIWQPPLREGVGIDAAATNGSWTVRGNHFADTDRAAVHAGGATGEGDATHNSFAASVDGPACTGTVDCSERLDAWPPESPVPTASPPSAATATPSQSPARTTASAAAPGGGTQPTPTAARTTGTRPATSSSGTTPSATTTAPLPTVLAVLALLANALAAGRRGGS